MTPFGPGREQAPGTLSSDRKLLINRYIAEGLGIVEEEEPEAEAPASAPAPPAPKQPPLRAVPPPAPLEPEPLLAALDPAPHVPPQTNGDGPHRSRGRPRGARKRRQVHFHVDPDEDQLLLRAAGHFGSQQKALIAALHALNEVLALRGQVEALQEECDRQRRLLAEAQALFRST
jgi:hypothetical protein